MIWVARRGSPRLAARLASSIGDLGVGLSLVAGAQEQRLGAVDLTGVDVAARELEVDVGVAHLHVRAGEALARLRGAPAEEVGLREGGDVALGIEAEPEAEEVELDQLRGDLRLLLAGGGVVLEDRLGLLQAADGEEVGRQQAGDVRGENQEVGIGGVPRQPGLEDAERDHRVGGVGGGAAEELDPGEEPARQRQRVGGGRVGPCGGGEQGPQLGIVPRVAGHPRGAGGGLADETGAQVGGGHAGDGALQLLAVGEQQIAERAARGVPSHRSPQHRGEPLLSFGVKGVEAPHDHRGRPVPERVFQGVDGAGAPAHAAPIPDLAGLVGPLEDLVEPILVVPDLRRQGRERGEGQGHLFVAAPGREDGDHHLGRRLEQPLLVGGDAGRLAPQLGGIVEGERVAERLEDDIVDVVGLEIAHLTLELGCLEGEHRIEQVMEELGAQQRALGGRDGQRLKDEARFQEVVLVGDAADASGLGRERASRSDRGWAGAMGAASPADRRGHQRSETHDRRRPNQFPHCGLV